MLRKCIQIFFLGSIILFVSCNTRKKIITDDFSTEAASSSAETEQGFSDSDLSLDESPAIVSDNNVPPTADTSAELSLEKELQSVTSESKSAVDTPAPEIPVANSTPVIDDAPVFSVPEPVVAAPPPIEALAVAPSASKISQIKDVQFKSNDSGGAFMISADQPLEYTTRMNSSTNQVIVEVQNVVVPKRLKRSLNTKDMTSSIGNIDIYQKPNSNIARFVIQLRPNSEQPLVQPEGTSLMLIGSFKSPDQIAENNSKTKNKNDPSDQVEINSDLTNESIMNTTGMDEYLANNTKFYGKKISIETTDINIKDVLKFISEESGVNMVFDDAITGTISVKLRKVPWDQAFVLVLKSKGLSYRRQGTVLRIASNDTLVKEEKAAIEIKNAKIVDEPLIVKNFSINYADINELEAKLKDFISSNEIGSRAKGRITSDKRTNMMIVTETATKLKQIDALIRALDTQPRQVMIEARIIEASEAFSKSLGTSWGLNSGVAFGAARSATNIGNPWSDPSPIQVSPSVGYASPQSQKGSAFASLWLGKLGVLGDLDVQLRLEETEDKIKILSSPRISVLTNTQATINQSFKVVQSTTKTISSTGVETSEPKFADVGVKLNVTPQISNLGTVRMVIDVIRTGIQPGGTTNSRDMKTEVIVKSGDTSVIGGVFQSDVLQSKSGVPGLKDIPILGTLFRGSNESHTKTELMVFVTPKILSAVVPTFSTAEATSENTESQSK